MRRLLLVILAIGAVTAACTGADDDDDDSGTPATVSGNLSGSDGGDNDTPIVGGTIEENGTNNSVTTGSGGVWTLTVDADEEVFIKGSAAGYYSSQRGVVVPVSGSTGIDISMPSSAVVAGVGGALGVTIDPTKGIVGTDFQGVIGTSGGFSASLSATNGGSFVFDSSGNPVLGSTTLPNGQNNVIFFNVDAGTTTITVDPPGAVACTPQESITSHRVDAETITNIGFDCL